MSAVDWAAFSVYVAGLVACVWPPVWFEDFCRRVRLFVELSVETYRIR